MTTIEIDAVSYQYSWAEDYALKEVSCIIPGGEFIGVLGLNNSGKSTFCYAVAGVIPHLYQGLFKGRILLDGKETWGQSVSEIAECVGLVLQVPQNQLSGVRYTVFDEIAFGLENRGIPVTEIKQRVESVLRILYLEEYARSSPFTLSGGEQQKLALATVLAMDPEVLVLDEPTTFLDPRSAENLFGFLHEFKRQGKTVIVAEQRVDLLARFAERILVLEEGELVLDGPVQDVLVSEELEKMHLAGTRYTRVASLARERGLWPKERKLSVSLEDTAEGLLEGRKRYGHPC